MMTTNKPNPFADFSVGDRIHDAYTDEYGIVTTIENGPFGWMMWSIYDGESRPLWTDTPVGKRIVKKATEGEEVANDKLSTLMLDALKAGGNLADIQSALEQAQRDHALYQAGYEDGLKAAPASNATLHRVRYDGVERVIQVVGVTPAKDYGRFNLFVLEHKRGTVTHDKPQEKSFVPQYLTYYDSNVTL